MKRNGRLLAVLKGKGTTYFPAKNHISIFKNFLQVICHYIADSPSLASFFFYPCFFLFFFFGHAMTPFPLSPFSSSHSPYLSYISSMPLSSLSAASEVTGTLSFSIPLTGASLLHPYCLSKPPQLHDACSSSHGSKIFITKVCSQRNEEALLSVPSHHFHFCSSPCLPCAYHDADT